MHAASAAVGDETRAHARDLASRGYAVLEDLLDEGEVRTLRDAIAEIARATDAPALYAPEAQPLADDVVITPTGLTIRGLLARRPDLEHLIVPRALSALVRESLGADARLELAGAVVSDRTRPFFAWHTHIDGEEESVRLRAGVWPEVRDVDRLLTLLYLDDLEEDALLVLPRRCGDPTAPPGNHRQRDWPGHVALRPRAGTLVALEQCTWHAADPLRRDGLRVFAGCYFAASRARSPAWADADLARRAPG
jgi:hypothetical protein